MRIVVTSTEEVALSATAAVTVAVLDLPYYSFIAYDRRTPRPSARPHHQRLQLVARLSRPDGTEIEARASIPFVGGKGPAARLAFGNLKPGDIPPGTEITSLRYEIESVST
jgi:hypothetical protein